MIRDNVSDLVAFIEVAREGSFTRAAIKLGVSQPALSHTLPLVIKMMSRKSGATLHALTGATGWLPHTARAALTGLSKRGYALTLERQAGKSSVYRVGVASGRAAA